MFQCGGRSNSEIAQAACESVYGIGQCTMGSCGSFSYWYYTGHTSCDSTKATGYEWIYANSGYLIVGEDYSCGSDDVSGNQLFVRYRSNSCWTLMGTQLACTGNYRCRKCSSVGATWGLNKRIGAMETVDLFSLFHREQNLKY